ncbi:hypothetical protein VSDG_01995 [Cytospora chrysosperma]|uniref:Uncharacterized protein n=1 Tax=Cytospora chrysosperma TaxID=252740 RepID=A0A423WE45_CYTCH|nr:hypothetical protein VSDG_01995 [Valsa sordida]
MLMRTSNGVEMTETVFLALNSVRLNVKSAKNPRVILVNANANPMMMVGPSASIRPKGPAGRIVPTPSSKTNTAEWIVIESMLLYRNPGLDAALKQAQSKG